MYMGGVQLGLWPVGHSGGLEYSRCSNNFCIIN